MKTTSLQRVARIEPDLRVEASINPRYHDDVALMQKAEIALQKAGLPDDFILVNGDALNGTDK